MKRPLAVVPVVLWAVVLAWLALYPHERPLPNIQIPAVAGSPPPILSSFCIGVAVEFTDKIDPSTAPVGMPQTVMLNRQDFWRLMQAFGSYGENGTPCKDGATLASFTINGRPVLTVLPDGGQ